MLGTVVSVLVYAQKRRLFEVVPSHVRKLWKDWEVRVLILLSLVLQIMLIYLGKRRKYTGRTRIRITIWSAYLLADWCAIFALGVISQNTLDDCKKDADERSKDELMAFWAPFLLLHLGGPDTITAYALEDNALWLRHLAGLVIQSALVIYVLLVALPGPSWFPYSSVLILLAGLVKYAERTLALRSANFENLRSSMLTEPDPGPNYAKFMEEFTLKKAEGFFVEAKEVKELPVQMPPYPAGEGKVISEARDHFETFKRLFVDLILSFQDRDNSQSYFQALEPEKAFKVIEVELGFAFDMFFTKAPIVYTVQGFILRLFTFSFTGLSLIIFSLLCEKDKYHIFDLVISYSLMGVALLLEIHAAVVLIKSDWMVHRLSKQNKTRESLFSSRSEHPEKPRWSNSMSQCNFLEFCLEEKPICFYKLQQLFQIDDFLENRRYRRYKEITDPLKSLIFNIFKKFTGTNGQDSKALCTRRGSFALGRYAFPSLDWITKVEFDQRMLIWHIATDLCYYSEEGENLQNASTNRTESKLISDYMLYLLIMCPFMLPIGIGMIRFHDTRAEAAEFFKERNLGSNKVGACTKLLEVNTEVSPAKVKGDRSKSVLFDACRVAKSLQNERVDRKWDIISEVWVEMLAYAATHCRGNHHAQQLRKGGELLTHVWLLMAHLGITEQFQIDQGHARAKLSAK